MKEWRFTGSEELLSQALLRRTKLPELTVAKLIEYGAVVWRSQGKGSWLRVRDGKLQLKPLDQLQIAYEPRVLSMAPFNASEPLWESKQYGIWHKPAGVMSQGTAAGDQCSMLYGVEKKGRTPFLVHRLDRETEGPMIIAYNGKAAGKLSELFQQQQVHKTYHAIVSHADLLSDEGKFTDTLDSKTAETKYKVLSRLAENRALVELKPITGRLHQIRRHLALNGSGVLGDPKYGKDNKNRDGMKLAAVGLEFIDPWERDTRSIKSLASFAQS